MTVKEKISQYLDYKGINTNAFETSIGASKSYWRNTKNISAEILVEIIRVYSDISTEWLLRGEGDMIRSNNIEDFKNSKEYQEYKKMEDLFIEFNRQTDVLLEDKDRTIRELQLKLARMEAEKIVENRIAG